MRVDVGCGRITWGPQAEEEVLADIARAGYAGASWSLREDRTMEEMLKQYARHGLRPVPGYFGADFWERERRDDIVAAAQRYARASCEAGLTELYVSAGGFDCVTRAGRTRRQAAAHVTVQDGLTDGEFEAMAATLDVVGAATGEWGVQLCYHNHVGSYVETEAEVERLLSMTNPDLVALGPDTGHLAWAGIDPVAFCRRHAQRIRTIHVKDVDQQVRRQGVAAGWDYRTFQQHGIWVEVGDGSTDFAALFSCLAGAGFDGWIVVETDVTQQASPFESARISREYLRGLGI